MLAGYKRYSRYKRARKRRYKDQPPENIMYIRRESLKSYMEMYGPKYSYRRFRFIGKHKVRSTLKDKCMDRNWVSETMGSPFITPYPNGFMCNPMRCSRNRRFLRKVGVKITRMYWTDCTSGVKLVIKKVK